MRVLRLHGSGIDRHMAAAIGLAVEAFNRGLDIRLRFLSIWIEEIVLELPESTMESRARTETALRESAPDLVLLVGSGDGVLAAAKVAGGAGVPLARVGSGSRNGSTADVDRAVDRLCTLHLVRGPAEVEVLRGEGCDGTFVEVGAPEDPGTAERVVGALGRARSGGSRRGG